MTKEILNIRMENNEDHILHLIFFDSWERASRDIDIKNLVIHEISEELVPKTHLYSSNSGIESEIIPPNYLN